MIYIHVLHIYTDISVKSFRIILGIIVFNSAGDIHKVHIKTSERGNSLTSHLEWMAILHASLMYKDYEHIIYTDSESYDLFDKHKLNIRVIHRTCNCADRVCRFGYKLKHDLTDINNDCFVTVQPDDHNSKYLKLQHQQNMLHINDIDKVRNIIKYKKKQNPYMKKLKRFLNRFKPYRIIQKHRYTSNKHTSKKKRKNIFKIEPKRVIGYNSTIKSPNSSYYYHFYQMRNQYDRKLFEDKIMLRKYKEKLKTTENPGLINHLNYRIDTIKHRLDEKIYI